MQIKQVESVFKLNIVSMIQMAKEAVPHLRRGSSIINTTSVTAYKAGLHFSSRELRWRLYLGIASFDRLFFD